MDNSPDALGLAVAATDILCDDQVILTQQYSTQWDSLAHVGQMFDADGKAEDEDLMEVRRKDRIVVEPGDFVLFRTGFDQMLLDMGKQPNRETLFSTCCALDGRDARLQQWVTESGAVALISDHFAVEAVPASLVSTTFAPHCRCTRTACSASAVTWVRCSI